MDLTPLPLPLLLVFLLPELLKAWFDIWELPRDCVPETLTTFEVFILRLCPSLYYVCVLSLGVKSSPAGGFLAVLI
jgi:hypothetical protein